MCREVRALHIQDLSSPSLVRTCLAVLSLPPGLPLDSERVNYQRDLVAAAADADQAHVCASLQGALLGLVRKCK